MAKLKLNSPMPSNRKFKKFQVYARDREGRVKSIHFGDVRYSDYTIHKNLKRLKSFRARHGCDPVSRLDKATPKYWSCQYLWNRRRA